MWSASLALLSSGVLTDALDLLGISFVAPHEPIPPPRDLLVQIQAEASGAASEPRAYSAMLCYAARLDLAARTGAVDLAHPLRELAPDEQARLRAWLVERSWWAWARAAAGVRALAGCPEPPAMVSEVARDLGYKPITLLKAAEESRLPVVAAGDRNLVYAATVAEAVERGMLRPAREEGGSR
ncbi:MAG TPA: hypothetical protein VFN76_04260 [Candidatus Limnocylindria bacterium]|nr:hypothetical protein [Candidatus Limnocylindria bacterium]